MTDFTNPRSLLNAHGLAPKKSFGQNFLVDASVSQDIAKACAAGSAHIVEFGAGTGALTRELLALDLKVTAVERDRDLIPILESEFREAIELGKLSVLEGDAKQVDLAKFATPRFVLCGNLPYQLTGPLLKRASEHAALLVRAVFMVQDEVAERLAAPADSKAYGALSVFTQAQFTVRKVRTVSRGCFYPAPDVTSAVVELTPHLRFRETPMFQDLVKRAFGARRKTLRNAWQGLRDEALLEQACSEAGTSLKARGETLSVETFAKIAARLA
jgi:16S rRNA (adenine1518-N6/adenine1519-N6)-dimethyltransferase